MHRDRVPVRRRSSHHGTAANPARPVLGLRPPDLSGSFRRCNLRQHSSCGFDLFIPFSSVQTLAFQKISKNRRTPDNADETDESKPNSRMIKTRMMGVTLMTLVIGKKLPRRGGRPEHRATDSRWQTRMTRPNLSFGGFDLSSRYYLKRSKIEISHNSKFLSVTSP